jgi:hypothetical protein
VSTKTSEETTKPAPRKRAVRRVVAKDDATPAPRKRAPRKVARVSQEEFEVVTERRAPTRFAAEASTRNSKRKTAISLAASLVAVVALAAWIGSTDAGQINVNQKIDAEASRQPQANIDVENQTEGELTVPVQNTPPAAISGLRGRGVGTAPVEQVAPEAAPATTTESVSTSTEEVVEGEGESSEAQTESTEAAATE